RRHSAPPPPCRTCPPRRWSCSGRSPASAPRSTGIPAACGRTRLANGLIIAAPRSGSGKTTLTLGLLAALGARGIAVAPAKTGPDYIDAQILSRVAGRDAVNLDPWAMQPERLRALATTQ